MIGSPACPSCGYDQSGIVAGWTSLCPLETRCPECGRAAASGLIFEGEEGPGWSLEHARRRFIRRWLRTTGVALRPRRLWRELRPEHAIRGRRLAWMAAGWLLTLHLTTAALIGGSALWMQMSPLYGWWPVMDAQWWLRVLGGLAWPYRGWFHVPLSATMSVGGPIYTSIAMGLGPYMAMAGLMLIWVRPLRRGEISRWHLVRALVLSLPIGIAAFVAGVLAFAAVALGQPVPEMDLLGAAVVALLLGGMAAALIWWWRCFAVEYLGCRKWSWTLVPLGLMALILTWVATFALAAALGP